MSVKILVFGSEDIKKDGTLKARNNALEMDEGAFKEYVSMNGLKLSKGYIDTSGSLSNGKRFRCWFYRPQFNDRIMIGVTGIINKIQDEEKGFIPHGMEKLHEESITKRAHYPYGDD